MKEIILKQKLSGILGMLLGGVFLAWIGFICAAVLNNIISIIPAIFGILGIRWIVIAAAMLLNRSRLSIRISPDGIELPTGTAFRPNAPKQTIPHSNILQIDRHVFLRGRGIKIIQTGGSEIFVDIRRYCSIKKFLTLCRKTGLPLA